MVKIRVTVVVVYAMGRFYYNNIIMATNTIIRWFQADTDIKSMPNVMDVRNGGILLSIYQITITMINAKDKGVVKLSQFCFELVLVLQ